MIKNIALFIVLIFTILIFKNHIIVSTSIIEACNLFIKKIFPSLFPMFIISSMLINLNLAKYINFCFKTITKKVFNISENCSYILFISIISGCPSNAKVAKELYKMSLISKNDVQKVILFTHFVSPLFIISMIHHRAGLIMFAHYFSNFIIGFFIRKKYNYEQEEKKLPNDNINFAQILISAINNSISTLLFILGTIVTFFIISSIINIPIFNVILELSQGLNYIINSTINIKLKTILLGSLLSFGGICIHLQIYGILNEIKINYWTYLIVRIIHAIISGVIIFIFY